MFIVFDACKHKENVAVPKINVVTEKPQPFDPTGLYAPKQKIELSTYEFYEFSLIVGYHRDSITEKGIVRIPTPSFAKCVFIDNSNPHYHIPINLYSDSSIITKDTLYLQFHDNRIGEIIIAGVFTQITSPFWSTVGDSNIITSPLVTITNQKKVVFNKKIDFRYNNDHDDSD
jgi:hypothetical protein